MWLHAIIKISDNKYKVQHKYYEQVVHYLYIAIKKRLDQFGAMVYLLNLVLSLKHIWIFNWLYLQEWCSHKLHPTLNHIVRDNVMLNLIGLCPPSLFR